MVQDPPTPTLKNLTPSQSIEDEETKRKKETESECPMKSKVLPTNKESRYDVLKTKNNKDLQKSSHWVCRWYFDLGKENYTRVNIQKWKKSMSVDWLVILY